MLPPLASPVPLSRRRPRRHVDDLVVLERRRAALQAQIDAAELDETDPQQLNLWLAERMLIDRKIGKLRQSGLSPEGAS